MNKELLWLLAAVLSAYALVSLFVIFVTTHILPSGLSHSE